MHAVVFQVDMNEGWEESSELDEIATSLRSMPGFVRGTWTTDGKRGLSFIVFESEEAARALADDSSGPPLTAATFRSVDVYEVVQELGPET
ncbi:MAG TPA: hypothetical protein VHG90_02785 [Acidimicrobiales bacterium]|nr:hypothetical protein [Acidimicrobiales bacterium]